MEHCVPDGRRTASPWPAKRGSGVILHCSNPEPLMSALGQKQTSNSRPLMSALPPKADMTP
jgi:hypothetical protein